MDQTVKGAIIGLLASDTGGLMMKIAGPSADAIGQYIKDRLSSYFADNLRAVGEKTESRLHEMGAEPQPVHPRLLLPIIEAAALEDDDSMQELWAQLLASGAADSASLHPGFIEILKQLAPQDARKLTHIYDVSNPPRHTVDIDVSLPSFASWNFSIETLRRLGLITTPMVTVSGHQGAANPLILDLDELNGAGPPLIRTYSFTEFGFAFMRACTGREPSTMRGKPYTER